MGVFGFISLLALAPGIRARIPGGGAAMGAGGGVLVLGCMAVGLGAFFVLLPGAFVLFYRSPNVKATCEAKDPSPSASSSC